MRKNLQISILCLTVIICTYIIIDLSTCALAYKNDGQDLFKVSTVEIFEDPNGYYSFEEVSTPDFNNRFKKVETNGLSFGMTNSVYWIRFSVPVSDKEKRGDSRILQFNNPNLDKVNLYLPINDTNNILRYNVNEMGISRPNNNTNWMFSVWGLQLPKNFYEGKSIYVRLESTSMLHTQILLWQNDAFVRDAFFNYAKFGIYYGVLIAMLLYNMFLFSALRDKTYFFYVCYIGSVFIYQLLIRGHLKLLIDFQLQLYNKFFWIMLAATFVFAILFTRNFLQTKINTPILDKFLMGCFGILLLQTGLGLFGYDVPANMIAHCLALLGSMLIFVLAIVRLRQGFSPARYYLLAWGILSVGTILWASSPYLVDDLTAVNCFLLATASESILLSFALADRVNRLRDEKYILGRQVTQLKGLSITDELTGLYNKRYLYKRLREELILSVKNKSPLSILVMDVDYFKSYNDQYGHLEGDKVLAKVGNILSGILRKTDLACRYGGEEFTIILPNSDANEAQNIAQRIQQEFFNTCFMPKQDTSVTITVSIGLTECKVDDTPDSIFKRADDALYEAKKLGRNRVECIM